LCLESHIFTHYAFQTLRGHEHVIETLCYGKKPTDAATIIAATGASSNGSSSAVDQVRNSIISCPQ
jgi:hypothetical protein